MPSLLCVSKESQRRTAPAYTMNARLEALKDSRAAYPAPCDYDGGPYYKRFCGMPEYSMGKVLPDRVHDHPGPGDYSPEEVGSGGGRAYCADVVFLVWFIALTCA